MLPLVRCPWPWQWCRKAAPKMQESMISSAWTTPSGIEEVLTSWWQDSPASMMLTHISTLQQEPPCSSKLLLQHFTSGSAGLTVVRTPKGCGLDSPSEHIPRLRVWSPVGNRWMFHTHVDVSPSLSHSQISKACLLGRIFKMCFWTHFSQASSTLIDSSFTVQFAGTLPPEPSLCRIIWNPASLSVFTS